MKPLYRNIFFLLGAIAVVIMLLTFDMDYSELWAHIRRAGWWFAAVVGVWVVIYFFNAISWYCIIRNGETPSPVALSKVYKLTISGFALNYATPCGLMGGEPYRIMELSPIIGTNRATSSVILSSCCIRLMLPCGFFWLLLLPFAFSISIFSSRAISMA